MKPDKYIAPATDKELFEAAKEKVANVAEKLADDVFKQVNGNYMIVIIIALLSVIIEVIDENPNASLISKSLRNTCEGFLNLAIDAAIYAEMERSKKRVN